MPRRHDLLSADELAREVRALGRIGRFLRLMGPLPDFEIVPLRTPDETGCNWSAHISDAGAGHSHLRRAIRLVQEHYNLG